MTFYIDIAFTTATLLPLVVWWVGIYVLYRICLNYCVFPAFSVYWWLVFEAGWDLHLFHI